MQLFSSEFIAPLDQSQGTLNTRNSSWAHFLYGIIPNIMDSLKARIPVQAEAARTELPRTMGLGTGISLVVSNVIGVGIFTTTGWLAAEIPNAGWLIAVWVLGGLLALAGALCYGELGARLPKAGGEYAFLRETYGPLAGFCAGWASFWVGFSAPIAAAALTCSKYFWRLLAPLISGIPGVDPGAMGTAAIPGKAVALAALLILTLVHCLNIRSGSRVHNILTFLKLALILLMIALGFLSGNGSWGYISDTSSVPVERLPIKMAVALCWVMFAYSGWNAACYVGSEIKEPAKKLPRALLIGTVIVLVLYVLLNLLYLYAVPLSDLIGKEEVGALAAERLFGAFFSPLFSLLVVITILGFMSAMIMAGPRVYYAMSRDGLFPAWMSDINPRTKTPLRAILFQSIWSAILIVMWTFAELLTFMGVVLAISSALTVSSLILVRRRKIGTESRAAWGYPLTPILYVGLSIWMTGFTIYEWPKASLAGIGIVAAGIPYYYWKRSRTSVRTSL
jgi:basic amino acid/polyamine antiporter, APA family